MPPDPLSLACFLFIHIITVQHSKLSMTVQNKIS